MKESNKERADMESTERFMKGKNMTMEVKRRLRNSTILPQKQDDGILKIVTGWDRDLCIRNELHEMSMGANKMERGYIYIYTQLMLHECHCKRCRAQW